MPTRPCAMRAGMAVATDQRGAGQSEGELRADDMDDAVAVLADVEQRMRISPFVSRMPRISGAPGGKVSSVRPGAVEMA